jgi:signal transduction histidine kinase
MRDELASFVRRYGDEALAAVITAIGLIEVLRLDEPVDGRIAAAAALVVVGSAAARRQQMPILFLALMAIFTVEEAFWPDLFPTPRTLALLLFLAVYSAAAHTSGRRTVIAGGLTIVMFLTNLAADYPAESLGDEVLFYGLIFAAPWAVGRAVRGRRLTQSRLRQQEADAETAILDERARIARELHDVIAHAITVMVLQARGGRRVLRDEANEAEEAFDTIDQTGRQALEEMRRLVDVLRTSNEAPDLAPQPSLEELDGLVEQIRGAGLPVELTFEGERQDLPPSIDVTAYRIVQEALTNVLKHAGPASVQVTVRYSPQNLELEIVDDGLGRAVEAAPGYGLIGMRERVSVYGGELQAERHSQGGFTLRVRLPLAVRL